MLFPEPEGPATTRGLGRGCEEGEEGFSTSAFFEDIPVGEEVYHQRSGTLASECRDIETALYDCTYDHTTVHL